MRISDWSSDVCSSDLFRSTARSSRQVTSHIWPFLLRRKRFLMWWPGSSPRSALASSTVKTGGRSEEHTSELQSLMRISYAVFCLKKKNNQTIKTSSTVEHTQH